MRAYFARQQHEWRHDLVVGLGTRTTTPRGDPYPQRMDLPSAKSRRLIVIALLALAAAVFAAAIIVATGNPDNDGLPAAIQNVQPAPGDNVLSQVEILVDLNAGYDADLVVNGVTIPREQLGEVRGLNVITYRAGEGRAVESLLPDQNCVQARYWEISTGPDSAKIFTWCFFTS